jgi:hypothetical protein
MHVLASTIWQALHFKRRQNSKQASKSVELDDLTDDGALKVSICGLRGKCRGGVHPQMTFGAIGNTKLSNHRGSEPVNQNSTCNKLPLAIVLCYDASPDVQ